MKNWVLKKTLWQSPYYRPFTCAVVSNALNGNVGFVLTSFAEFNYTVSSGKNCEIFTNAYVLTRMVYGTSLADNYVTGDSRLPTENLYTQPFALGVAAVLNATFTLFVCHLL
jgi:hypothetical protein